MLVTQNAMPKKYCATRTLKISDQGGVSRDPKEMFEVRVAYVPSPVSTLQ